MASPHHSIKTAARLTGLSQHLIRIWEKRYRAVEPDRTATNRRLYSDADIERLNLLREATRSGHTIGNVARLPLTRLKRLVAKAESVHPDEKRDRGGLSPAQSFHDECIAAIKVFDSRRLESIWERAIVALGHQGMLRLVIAPLAHTVGELWRSGIISAAHEHFLTASLKVFLGHVAGRFSISGSAPRIIIATPVGQLHELGAVIVEDSAAQLGWYPVYLGPNLPAAEIAGAVVQNQASAVALSIVYPSDDPDLPQELLNLRRFVPAQVPIFVGGRAAEGYSKTLDRIGATVTDEIDEFSNRLDALRRLNNRHSW
jgi:DNA-binding transcriptional MerR regulator/methylmalonyl-CoA mutase cobalamin-binding subunit